jgi:hypothetical protein
MSIDGAMSQHSGYVHTATLDEHSSDKGHTRKNHRVWVRVSSAMAVPGFTLAQPNERFATLALELENCTTTPNTHTDLGI